MYLIKPEPQWSVNPTGLSSERKIHRSCLPTSSKLLLYPRVCAEDKQKKQTFAAHWSAVIKRLIYRAVLNKLAKSLIIAIIVMSSGTLLLQAEFAPREGKLLTACRRAETQASVRYAFLPARWEQSLFFFSLSLHFVQLTEQLSIMLAGMWLDAWWSAAFRRQGSFTSRLMQRRATTYGGISPRKWKWWNNKASLVSGRQPMLKQTRRGSQLILFKVGFTFSFNCCVIFNSKGHQRALLYLKYNILKYN